MIEVKCNLHVHSIYSDGSGDYTLIANEALDSGLDVVIITDHNVLVKGVEKYYEKDGKRLLLLTGEEVHDQNRMPQKNHMLVIGCSREVAQHAHDPQVLINKVRGCGGLTFLAHPYEYALPLFNETDITWEAWDTEGFTGLELWNGFSEFKTVVHNLSGAIFHAFFPELIPHQPLPQALARWDDLLAAGKKVVAVAGSDAHALHYKYGPIRKIIFPYRYHFSTINNHLLLPEPLTGNVQKDGKAVYNALGKGSSYICLDAAASPEGFTFTAENDDTCVSLGEEVYLNPGATIRINLPRKADIRLIHNGMTITELNDSDLVVKTIDKPGAYRMEAYLNHLGKQRAWIFSNPVYAKRSAKKQIDLQYDNGL